MRAWPIGVTAALLLALALPAASQQSAEGEPGEPEGEEAGAAAESATLREVLLVEESLPFLPSSNTIATKLPMEVDWTPAHVGVVELAAIEEQHAVVLGDALENVSGLNVQTGNGVFDFFVLRGFDSLSGALVLTDGSPEPEATFYQLYNTERVEVFKGPAGFLYGSNPLAGVVNMVRKQPVPSDFGVVGLSAGSWSTFEGRVDLNRASTSGSVDLRLNALGRQSDGYRDGLDSEVLAVNPALTWRPGERSSLNLNLEAVSADYAPDAGLPLLAGRLLEVPRSRSYASPLDRSEQEILRLQSDYEIQLSDSLALRNKTYLRRLDWLSDGTLIGPVLLAPRPQDWALLRTLVSLDDDQELLGNQLEARWLGSTGGIEHQLLAGLELARFSDDYSIEVHLLPPISVFDPVESGALPLIPFDAGFQAGDVSSRVVAPYLLDQIAISERVRLLAGLRFDSIHFEESLSGESRRDEELSPILGAIFAPGPRTAVYANFARSFAPPSPRLTRERRPEKSRQLEIGLRRSWPRKRARGSLALYQLERENLAIPDQGGVTQQPGDQRSRGLEAEFSAELRSGVRAMLAYAYNDSELTRFVRRSFNPRVVPPFVDTDLSGNRPPFAPEHLLRFWLSADLGGRWSLGGGARLTDDQFTSEENDAELDGDLTLDAAVTYSADRWRLRLNLQNFLDEEYETRGFGSSSVIPAPPAAVTLSFDYRL